MKTYTAFVKKMKMNTLFRSKHDKSFHIIFRGISLHYCNSNSSLRLEAVGQYYNSLSLYNRGIWKESDKMKRRHGICSI